MGRYSFKLDKPSSNETLAEAHRRTLYENCLDGVMLTMPDGSILSANPQACLIFGMTEEEIMAAGRDRLVVADEMLDAAIMEREQTGKTRSELTYRRRDGTTFIGETTSCIFTDADGCTRASIIIRDITERKKAEVALMESRAHISAIFDSTDDLIWSVDPVNFGLITFNRGLREFISRECGVDIAEGMVPHDILTADDSAVWWCEAYRRTMEEGSFNTEYTVGAGKHILHLSFNLLRRGQEIFGISIFGRDITESKKAENALQASESFLNSIIDQSPLAIWISDDSGMPVRINRACLELMRISEKEVLGKYNIFRDNVVQEQGFMPLVRRVFESGETARFEIRYDSSKVKDLHLARSVSVMLAVTIFPVRDQHGKIVNAVIHYIDLTERKQAEKELGESQKKYQALIETTGDFIWEMDSLGRYTYCSPQMEKLWGFKPEEMIGKTPFDVVPAGDRERVIEKFLAVANSQTPFNGLDTTAYDSQGRLIFLETSGVPFFDDDGKLLGFRGITRDITERKQAENFLRESKERYYSLFNSMTEGFALHEIICDDHGMPVDYRFLDINPAFEKLTGLKRADVIGRTQKELLPGEDPLWVREYGAVALTGEPARFENYSASLGRHFEVFAYCPGKRQFAVMFTDITEHRKMEEDLQKVSERLELAQRVSGAGTWDWNVLTGQIVWSSEMFALFGLNQAVTGASFEAWNSVLHPDDCEAASERVDRALREHASLNSEYRIIRPDGQVLWINALGQGKYDSEGRPVRMIGLCIDVTERKRSEKELQESESFLNSIIDQSPLAIWISDDRGTLIRINQACLDLLQISEDEVLGKYNLFNDNIVEEQGFMPLVRRVFESGETARFEIGYDSSKVRDLHLARSTSVILVVTIFPVRDPGGKIINAVIQHIDATERKKAENCLKDSEERYHKLFEVESDALFLVDCESRNVIDANPSALRMYGYTLEEMLGMNICDISVQKDKTLQAIADLEKYISLSWHSRKNGTVFPVEIACSYFEFQGCQVLVAAIRDITVRKGFEAKLKHSESRYRSLFKHSPIATLEEDFSKVQARFNQLRSSGISDFREYFRSHPEEVSVLASMVKILDINQAGMEFFRVGDMGYIPTSRSAFFVESLWEVFTEELASLAEGSTSFEDEVSIQLLNGDDKIAYLNVSVVPGCESTLSRVLVSLVDITERKRMDAIILDQLEFLQQLLDAIPAPLFYKDRHGIYMGCNRAFESYLGRDRSDIVGMSVYDLSPRDLADKYHEMDMELLENPGAQVYESSILYADGTRHDVIFNKATYNRADGSIAGLIGIILDITERKKAEQVREELLRDLEFKNAEMERFVYTVSHELRSPLITINGFADLLKLDLQKGSTDRIDADLNIIHSAVIKMDHLLRDTLELSRIGRVVSQPDNIWFGDVAGEVVSQLESRIRARGAQVEVALDLPSVYADRMRVAEVLTNLIENSIKYMGDQTQPRIEIGYRQSCGAFYVKDNGIGIHPSQHQKVFRGFLLTGVIAAVFKNSRLVCPCNAQIP